MSAVLRKPRKAIGEITRDGISLIANLFAPNHLRLFLNRSNILFATIPATIEMNDPINTGSVSPPSSDLLSIEAAWATAVGKRRFISRADRLDWLSIFSSTPPLRVEGVSKCKDGKPCLQVSGMASVSRVSESRVRGIGVILVSKYTGILRINTDNLKISINTDYLKAPP
jgi:hypothetical protein